MQTSFEHLRRAFIATYGHGKNVNGAKGKVNQMRACGDIQADVQRRLASFSSELSRLESEENDRACVKITEIQVVVKRLLNYLGSLS